MNQESKTDQVWRKGAEIPGESPDVWRRDKYQNRIRKNLYGDTNSVHGWEMDHIVPVSQGGSNDVSNLQPLQWEKNRELGDKT